MSTPPDSRAEQAGPRAGVSRVGTTRAQIRAESRAYEGRGGTSTEAGRVGLLPAFLDRESGVVYPARYADGRLAPLHLLEGLPDALVIERDVGGRVSAVKRSVIAGFARNGCFFTRAQAARMVASGARSRSAA